MRDYDYLTNISRDKKGIIEEAARRSGFNVEYKDHPVPKDLSDPEDEFYEPSLLRDCGSVYTNEPRNKDHTLSGRWFMSWKRKEGSNKVPLHKPLT